MKLIKENLSRQEKRRARREKETKTAGQILRERQLIVNFLGLSMQVLHDDFGFGTKRLKHFGDRIEKNLDCINADYLTFGDILNNLNIKE